MPMPRPTPAAEPQFEVTAGNVQIVAVGDTVALDGAATMTPGDANPTFHWSFTAAPANSLARIADPSAAQTSFVADASGNYIVQLIVTAGGYSSQRALVSVFAGTPPVTVQAFDHTGIAGNCWTCHNGAIAPGSTPNHITTTATCEACHSVVGWKPVILVDHGEALGACTLCHNGTAARGKPANHAPTTEECDVCHTRIAWLPGASDHPPAGIPCQSCHNGTNATGKPANHVSSSDDCTLCHAVNTWTVSVFDHRGVTGSCVTCHNGSIATGKPAAHIPSTDLCEACHSTISIVPVSRVDHTQVLGACDSTVVWDSASGGSPGSGGSTGFNHAVIVDGCVMCHNGLLVPGKPADHPPTSDECNQCHTTQSFDGGEEDGECNDDDDDD